MTSKEEAKVATLLCPFRFEGSKVYGCYGSQCMAWEWDQVPVYGLHNRIENWTESTTRGFCARLLTREDD